MKGQATDMQATDMRAASAPRRSFLLIPAIALALLSGCASRESRVEGALLKAGISGRLARCLAPRLAERLNDDQLRALAQAAKADPGEARGGIGGVIARVAATRDPVIVEVVTQAGLHCALKG